MRPEDPAKKLNRNLIVLIIGFLRHYRDGRTAHLVDKPLFLQRCCSRVAGPDLPEALCDQLSDPPSEHHVREQSPFGQVQCKMSEMLHGLCLQPKST